MSKKPLKNEYMKPELVIHGDLSIITASTNYDIGDGEKGPNPSDM